MAHIGQATLDIKISKLLKGNIGEPEVDDVTNDDGIEFIYTKEFLTEEQLSELEAVIQEFVGDQAIVDITK